MNYLKARIYYIRLCKNHFSNFSRKELDEGAVSGMLAACQTPNDTATEMSAKTG
jgi:hypothetical protein